MKTRVKIFKGLLVVIACVGCFFIGASQKSQNQEVVKVSPIPKKYVNITRINGWDENKKDGKMQLIIQTDEHDYIVIKEPFTSTAIDTYID